MVMIPGKPNEDWVKSLGLDIYKKYMNQGGGFSSPTFSPYQPNLTSPYSPKSTFSSNQFKPTFSMPDFSGLIDTIMNINNPNSFGDQQKIANQQAARMAGEQRNKLNSSLSLLQSNRDNAMKTIDNSLADANKALEDRSFMNYLASRQNIANRGLSGSGISDDADTRLSLNKQREVAAIERDVANQRSSVESEFNTRSQAINDALSSIDESGMANELFQQLRSQAISERGQQASMLGNVVEMMRALNQDQRGMFESDRSFDFNVDEADRGFKLQEGQLTGNYVPPEVQSLVDQIIQGKKDWGATQDANQRKQIASNVEGLRQQLSAMPYGIDANKLFGSNVDLSTSLKNAGSLSMPTLANKQFQESNSQFNKTFNENQRINNRNFNEEQRMNNATIENWKTDNAYRDKTFALEKKLKEQEYNYNDWLKGQKIDEKKAEQATRNAMSDLMAFETPEEARKYILDYQDALSQNGVDIQSLLNMWKVLFPDPDTELRYGGTTNNEMPWQSGN